MPAATAKPVAWLFSIECQKAAEVFFLRESEAHSRNFLAITQNYPALLVWVDKHLCLYVHT